MRGGTGLRGYTIIEVMIFLIISGVMFIIAATFISGKQSKAEFKQGMSDINNQVQQVINDVSNGYYPSQNNFRCTAGSSGSLTFFTVPPNTQGSNQNCVFLGKIIQFGSPNVGSNNPNLANYDILTIAGRQYIGGPTTTSPSDFSQSFPVAVVRPINPIDLTDHKVLQWGITVTKMYVNSTANPIGGVGFFGSFNRSSGGTLSSGSQTVLAIPIATDLTNTQDSAVANYVKNNTLSMDSAINANSIITVCFIGGSGQFGSLIIGDTSGQRLTTSIQIATNNPPAGC